MSCFNCFKWITCCGLGCGLISSIGDICKGIKTVKEDIVEKFQPKKIYYLHKEGNFYEDLQSGDVVEIAFFKGNPSEKTKAE
jgi:hypothetical protein